MSKTINVELYVDERDFIIDLLEYALLDDLLDKLKKAKPNRENNIIVALDSYDLDSLIGNLSLEVNHNKKQWVKEAANDIAECLESYETLIKKRQT